MKSLLGTGDTKFGSSPCGLFNGAFRNSYIWQCSSKQLLAANFYTTRGATDYP